MIGWSHLEKRHKCQRSVYIEFSGAVGGTEGFGESTVTVTIVTTYLSSGSVRIQ